MIRDVNHSLGDYRFNDAAGAVYQFIWHELCDWYVEMIKPELYGDDAETKGAALNTLVHVFETSLALLHPFMPFITEEIWQQLPCSKESDSLCIRKYPSSEDGIEDREAEERMNIIMDAVTAIRNIRGELNLSPSLELKVLIRTANHSEKVFGEYSGYITKLARAKGIEIGKEIQPPRHAASAVRPLMEIFVPLEGLFDLDVEISRLKKEKDKIDGEIRFVQKKLVNEDFVKKAPKAVVEENRAKYQEYLDKSQSIEKNIEKLEQWRKSDE